MEIIIHERDDISHVILKGRLDSTGVEEMDQPFTEATTGRGLPTVVDMSGITFMSSLGIGFLFANTKKLKKAGCKLVLLNPQGMVEAVLKTSKMDKVMPLFYELEEAIRAVGGDPSIGVDVSPTEADAKDSDSPVAEQESDSVPRDKPDNILKLSITNEMSELEGLYATVNEFLTGHEVPYRSGYAVNLALEELAVNVIRYAYVDDDEHPIEFGLGIVDEQIILEIRDAGRPFDPREAPSHDIDADDLDVGGLGLTLVIDMVDALTYRREDDKNHVQVCIQLRAEEGSELWSAVNDGASAGSA
ncbi:MAG: anti-sigma factor antagonist [Planctomycetes bacterium]|nr:anti-sigma factor antagonist [Planctomycetota bacterium]